MQRYQKDLRFLSGNYIWMPIPKEQAYLKQYFTTEKLLGALRYMLAFGDMRCFNTHTGLLYCKSFRTETQQMYLCLLKAHRHAKANMDFAKLMAVEGGTWVPCKKAHVCESTHPDAAGYDGDNTCLDWGF